MEEAGVHLPRAALETRAWSMEEAGVHLLRAALETKTWSLAG